MGEELCLLSENERDVHWSAEEEVKNRSVQGLVTLCSKMLEHILQ